MQEWTYSFAIFLSWDHVPIVLDQEWGSASLLIPQGGEMHVRPYPATAPTRSTLLSYGSELQAAPWVTYPNLARVGHTARSGFGNRMFFLSSQSGRPRAACYFFIVGYRWLFLAQEQ